MPTITPTKTPKVVAKSNAKPAVNAQIKTAIRLGKITPADTVASNTRATAKPKPLVPKAGFTYSKRRLEYGGQITT